MAKMNKEEQSQKFRDDLRVKMERWDDFRTRRVKAIDDYIRIKQHFYRGKIFRRHIQVIRHFKSLYDIFKIVREKYKKKRTVLRVGFKWKLWLNRNGGGLEKAYKNRVRSAITLFSQYLYYQKEQDAIETLRPLFMEFFFRKITLMDQFRNCIKLLHKIQKKIRDQRDTSHSQLLMLEKLWAKHIHNVWQYYTHGVTNNIKSTILEEREVKQLYYMDSDKQLQKMRGQFLKQFHRKCKIKGYIAFF